MPQHHRDNPDAHYKLGLALKSLGEYEAAADAFEVVLKMAPNGNVAREQLVDLYAYHLNQPEKSKAHAQAFDRSLQGEIYVVSGLPRSGTSMMMQMLEAGGFPIFSDEKRSADANNEKGYYEHEAVKSLIQNKKWLPEAKGKVVKVVANLLPHLPPRFKYKVVFIERDLIEVLASQHKMLHRMGKKSNNEVYPIGLMQVFEQQVSSAKQWASSQTNVEIIHLQHRDVIDFPFEAALKLQDFFNNQLLPELMAQVVDNKLYQEQINSNTSSSKI